MKLKLNGIKGISLLLAALVIGACGGGGSSAQTGGHFQKQIAFHLVNNDTVSNRIYEGHFETYDTVPDMAPAAVRDFSEVLFWNDQTTPDFINIIVSRNHALVTNKQITLTAAEAVNVTKITATWDGTSVTITTQ